MHSFQRCVVVCENAAVLNFDLFYGGEKVEIRTLMTCYCVKLWWYPPQLIQKRSNFKLWISEWDGISLIPCFVEGPTPVIIFNHKLVITPTNWRWNHEDSPQINENVPIHKQEQTCSLCNADVQKIFDAIFLTIMGDIYTSSGVRCIF